MGLVCNVGWYEKGRYQSKIGKIRTREYELWRGILKRCYDEKALIRMPTYKGCEVSEDFKNFQYFAEWCNKRKDFKNSDWHLDKDILVRDNKIYSENHCCFVPCEVNMLFTKRKILRGNSPIGVTFHIGQRKYNSRIMIDGEKVHLGSFDSEIKAFEVYKDAKERYLKIMAERYKGLIYDDVYSALCNYEVSIND